MDVKQDSASINRREFLKAAAIIVGGLASASVGTAFTPPPKTLGGKISSLTGQYKGISNGYIYESLDGGKTCQVAAYFGSGCAIPQVSLSKGWLIAQVVSAGTAFNLKSQNGRMWYSQDYKSPGGVGIG